MSKAEAERQTRMNMISNPTTFNSPRKFLKCQLISLILINLWAQSMKTKAEWPFWELSLKLRKYEKEILILYKNTW